ncbi:MAG TPA: hypothetical protein VG538_09405 [Vicinamibacterales bacterium]|nr:hypothetical protein [Vicinamibacterales bacterium]
MIRSLVLFAHITGVLMMFAGLALEGFGGESASAATSRISSLGVLLTVIAGFYLGARFGVLGHVWMRASYAAIVVMMAAGSLARRSDTLRRISLRVRGTFGMAVVFLMIAKPDTVISMVVLAAALGVSTLVTIPIGLDRSNSLSSTGA